MKGFGAMIGLGATGMRSAKRKRARKKAKKRGGLSPSEQAIIDRNMARRGYTKGWTSGMDD